MEHPFFPTTTTRADALRWLTIAEKLLSTRDLTGSRSFATRARDSDPTLTHADQILAVADTLIAGDRRVGNNQQDWYAILRLTPQQGREADVIASQYRALALILNPQTNNFPFAEQAFRLVVDAWGVLSNPSRKSMYDKELGFYLYTQQQPDPFSNNPSPAMQQNVMVFGGGGSSSSWAHFSQVQQVNASTRVNPVGSGSTRGSQNFMGFNPGYNPFFVSGSGSRPSHEVFSKPGQETYPTFASNVASINNQLQQNYSNVGDKISPKVNVSENIVEEGVEDEGNVEEMYDDDDEDEDDDVEERVDEPINDDMSRFWTTCPYCYYMYEYPSTYIDCTLCCQNCKSAFQAVSIPSPPPIVDGQEVHFCCWGFLPFGFSKTNWRRSYGRPKSSIPRVYVDDDDDDFVEISNSSGSDDDWYMGSEKRKKVRNVRGKGYSGTSHR